MSSFHLTALTLLFFSSSAFSQQASFCPSSEDVAPCECTQSGFEIFQLICDGPSISQENIVQLMRAVRSRNGLTPADPFHVYWFELKNTLLTSVDLTPLYNMDIQILAFENNPAMTTFTGETGDAGEVGKFKAGVVNLDENQLTSSDLADGGRIWDFFKFIQVVSPGHIYFATNRITEIVLGLEKKIPLIGASYPHNNLTRIENAPFENYTNVNVMNFWDNQINYLGVDAFKLNAVYEHDNGYRQIGLENNQLNDDRIHETAFNQVNGPVVLRMPENEFEFLSAAKFKIFLDAVDQFGRQSRLEVKNNRFICDERMRWLRDGKESYESRVEGVDCENDPGYTIFTTNLLA